MSKEKNLPGSLFVDVLNPQLDGILNIQENWLKDTPLSIDNLYCCHNDLGYYFGEDFNFHQQFEYALILKHGILFAKMYPVPANSYVRRLTRNELLIYNSHIFNLSQR